MKKLIFASALLALIGSPALAQSTTATYGTGNTLPFSYPMQSSKSGTNAFAQAPARSTEFTGSINQAPLPNGENDPDPNIRAQLRWEAEHPAD